MEYTILKPRKALNKAFLKVKPSRSDIERFKANFLELLDNVKEGESEEFHKNLISDFLKKTYYAPDHFINTKDRNDLVIHNGKNAKSSVGVIIETKNPANKSEMLRVDQINTKALQELLLYYLRERITNKNLEIRYLIATNVHEWFIFDAQVFERKFAQNKELVRMFMDFDGGRLAGTKTEYFYKEVAQRFINEALADLTFTHIDLRSYEKNLRNAEKERDTKLIPLYKLLSPEHLLKLPFSNDSNTLDRRFYSELLHIMGLTERKEKGKKLIERQAEGERDSGSLIENALLQLDSLDKLSRLKKPSRFGETRDERLFNVALQLALTWTNRVLFLKLLEAQLISYHKGDRNYAFLDLKKVGDYDELNSLFFEVLARTPAERSAEIQAVFGKVPYLNSSLFEPTDIEQVCFCISQIKTQTLPVFKGTVLKDENGRKRTGEMDALEYLFKFLDAYDFTSDGGEEVQEDNKALINASVLGLIFEKINGYKDGSFFTPGFITMYMCRETIRRAVLQKFNDSKPWNCKTIDELYDRIDDKKEANEIVNSLKICDPAVGSGHFLVSALNEIIALKSELKILLYRDGKTLRDYEVEVVNDELVVTDSDGGLFEYRPGSAESQRVQEALFHEKQTIIESCLFGVDINPNSVKICRLRLWIELLKNTYYKAEDELETLPNIDINIKCGNSLISRFDLDADLKKALKKSKWNISAYRLAVMSYRNAETKEQKHAMEKLIDEIKNGFEAEISTKDRDGLRKARNKLMNHVDQTEMFELSKKEKTAWEKMAAKLTQAVDKLEKKIEEIESNKIYEDAFEWRFEFPEVLDDDGKFIGFDCVIGNPPYMRVQEIQKTQPAEKKYYGSKYLIAKASYDLANLFFEKAVEISNHNASNAYIFPHKFFNSASTAVFREYLSGGQYIDKITHFGANMIFDDADTYTCIAQFSKTPNNGFHCYKSSFRTDFQSEMKGDENYGYITYESLNRISKLYGGNQWILLDTQTALDAFCKIYEQEGRIGTKFENVSQGIATGKDEIYLFEGQEADGYVRGRFVKDDVEREIEKGIMKPFLKGKAVQRYQTPEQNLFILFPYKLSETGRAELLSEKEIKRDFPNAYLWLKETEVMHRKKDNRSTNDDSWYRYARKQGVDNVEVLKLSSMEICAKNPNVILDDKNFYHNTKVYSWYKKSDTKESYEYLLAVANSKLLWWFLKSTGDTLQGDARTFKTNYLNPFPLPENVSEKQEATIVSLVEQILELKKENPAADVSELEAEIDRLVYTLYDLTKEEIAIVEAAAPEPKKTNPLLREKVLPELS